MILLAHFMSQQRPILAPPTLFTEVATMIENVSWGRIRQTVMDGAILIVLVVMVGFQLQVG